jgi:hydroxymethylbilane synthase
MAEVAEGDHGPELWLRAVALAPDGSAAVRLSASGSVDDPSGVGRKLAAEMLGEGAADLLAEHP